MVEQVTVEHIIDYTGGIERASMMYRYEAMCEMIVKLNPSYKMKNLSAEYENVDDMSAKEFLRMKLDAVLSDEIKEVITIKQYELWIQSSLQGFRDYGVQM